MSIGFEEFDLEQDALCRADYVELRDGGSADSSLVGRYCGSNGPIIYNANSDKLWLKFHTDGKVQGTGFEATWTMTEEAFEIQNVEGEGGDEYKPLPSPASKFGATKYSCLQGIAGISRLGCVLLSLFCLFRLIPEQEL